MRNVWKARIVVVVIADGADVVEIRYMLGCVFVVLMMVERVDEQTRVVLKVVMESGSIAKSYKLHIITSPRLPAPSKQNSPSSC